MQTVSWFLAGLCLVNCVCAYSKSRTYRLFEKEEEPTTPNAKLVNVDNSPGQFLRDLAGRQTPNGEVVWEVKIWDPEMFSIAIFCSFSPIHVLNIWSHTVTFSLFQNALLSAMLLTLTYLYDTKLKDKSLIASEAFREYNSKFVSPRLSVAKRDVGISTDGSISVSSPSLPRPGTKIIHTPLRRNTESPIRANREWDNSRRPLTASSNSPIKSPVKLRPAGYTASRPENLVPVKKNIWSEVYAPSPLAKSRSFHG
ncbi:Meiotically up-regulated gene 154 protein [Neolecta irregularis DAH-3]|uniref:Meiotically up-regulated gene 154 protein n=1 Tax=Neolecta irregularis (strain DAH-3) TaxID=1198029 RepID=A0A1U7LIM7_NEOID|nr:Meiotically up-regulated gene 154 protein [Neolecta irregularis DAH-3]|eukprot:OLL22381.1 Meiotically up-regulated gene 154 protein [Neolecta irregularis DAH-3]